MLFYRNLWISFHSYCWWFAACTAQMESRTCSLF